MEEKWAYVQAVHKERENFLENVPRKEPDSDSGDDRDDVILYVYAEPKYGGPIIRAFSLEKGRLAEREELITYYHTYGVPLPKFPIHALRCTLILRFDLAKYLLKDEIQPASLRPFPRTTCRIPPLA